MSREKLARYTLEVSKTIPVELDANELKLLLVAIRQVRHTFNIAEAQSRAAGEPLDPQYEPVQEAYNQLERKLEEMMQELSNEGPILLK
jgi:hypothetical protein